MDIGSISPVIGALFGAALTATVNLAIWMIGRRNDRKSSTLKRYRFYYSREMGEARFKAELLIRKNSHRDWSTFDPYQSESSDDEREGYSEVIRFFHLLAILYEEHEVLRKLTAKLFAREYGYWDGLLFRPMKDRHSWWTGPAIREFGRKIIASEAKSLYLQGLAKGQRQRGLRILEQSDHRRRVVIAYETIE